MACKTTFSDASTAYVTFATDEEAAQAVEDHQGDEIEGRAIMLQIHLGAIPREGDETPTRKSDFSTLLRFLLYFEARSSVLVSTNSSCMLYLSVSYVCYCTCVYPITVFII